MSTKAPELTLDDLLMDDLIRLLMDRDGVEAAEVRRLLQLGTGKGRWAAEDGNTGSAGPEGP